MVTVWQGVSEELRTKEGGLLRNGEGSRKRQEEETQLES